MNPDHFQMRSHNEVIKLELGAAALERQKRKRQKKAQDADEQRFQNWKTELVFHTRKQAQVDGGILTGRPAEPSVVQARLHGIQILHQAIELYKHYHPGTGAGEGLGGASVTNQATSDGESCLSAYSSSSSEAVKGSQIPASPSSKIVTPVQKETLIQNEVPKKRTPNKAPRNPKITDASARLLLNDNQISNPSTCTTQPRLSGHGSEPMEVFSIMTEEKVTVPNSFIGRIVGPKHRILRLIADDSGATISIEEGYSDPQPWRTFSLCGSNEAVVRAQRTLASMQSSTSSYEKELSRLNAHKIIDSRLPQVNLTQASTSLIADPRAGCQAVSAAQSPQANLGNADVGEEPADRRETLTIRAKPPASVSKKRRRHEEADPDLDDEVVEDAPSNPRKKQKKAKKLRKSKSSGPNGGCSDVELGQEVDTTSFPGATSSSDIVRGSKKIKQESKVPDGVAVITIESDDETEAVSREISGFAARLVDDQLRNARGMLSIGDAEDMIREITKGMVNKYTKMHKENRVGTYFRRFEGYTDELYKLLMSVMDKKENWESRFEAVLGHTRKGNQINGEELSERQKAKRRARR